MQNSIRPLIGALCAALALTGWADEAAAGSKKAPSLHQVTVPFTCGQNTTDLDSVVLGDFATTVQVINPHASTPARTRVSLSHPESAISDWVNARFAPLGSRKLDCGELDGGLFTFPAPVGPSELYQGFLVIQSYGPLDVVVLQTIQGESGGVASSSERVPARRFRGRIDAAEVELCHVPPGNPANAHTIEVGSPSVGAHLAHGDYLGACQP